MPGSKAVEGSELNTWFLPDFPVFPCKQATAETGLAFRNERLASH